MNSKQYWRFREECSQICMGSKKGQSLWVRLMRMDDEERGVCVARGIFQIFFLTSIPKMRIQWIQWITILSAKVTLHGRIIQSETSLQDLFQRFVHTNEQNSYAQLLHVYWSHHLPLFLSRIWHSSSCTKTHRGDLSNHPTHFQNWIRETYFGSRIHKESLLNLLRLI